MPIGEALERARLVVEAARAADRATPFTVPREAAGEHDVVGGAWAAAGSSFLFFASGAIIPVLPWIFGLQGGTAVIVALVLVGIALLSTGAMVGILSGGPPLRRALRQLAIGFGAAAITYLLGLLFGVGAV
jgi:VIT1/CCC1 family predicted Fe2+/Mn2+ transporter